MKRWLLAPAEQFREGWELSFRAIDEPVNGHPGATRVGRLGNLPARPVKTGGGGRSRSGAQAPQPPLAEPGTPAVVAIDVAAFSSMDIGDAGEACPCC